MLDTLRLRSPALLAGQLEAVWRKSQTRLLRDNETGEEVWQVVSGDLEGSFDHRLSVQIRHTEIKPKPKGGGTYAAEVPPYVIVEGSVHKGILGHNLYGGPLDPVAAGRWMVDQVADRVGHWLPGADRWEISRVDWAEVYDLGSYEAVEAYISGLAMVPFHRRKNVQRQGNHSVLAVSDRVTLRIYAKGHEFADHDHRRLKKLTSAGEAEQLQEAANRLLRVETQLNAQKLRADFRVLPRVEEMTQLYLEGVHDYEVSRLLREGKEEMETVRTLREVRKRLHDCYKPGLARGLLSTWHLLSMLPEKDVRTSMNRRTFYYHRKKLEEAAISWHGTDVQLITSGSWLPAGFVPRRDSCYRLLEEDIRVRQVLDPYRVPQVAA